MDNPKLESITSPETILKDDHSAEFMLKEYDRFVQLFIEENRQTEQRVNFFLTIASGAVGVIILISQVSKLSGEILYVATLAVLVVLLLFGLSILNRTVTRIVQNRTYHEILVEVQKYFATRDPEVAAYLEFKKSFAYPKDRSRIINQLSDLAF